jgi:hypothetical protein
MSLRRFLLLSLVLVSRALAAPGPAGLLEPVHGALAVSPALTLAAVEQRLAAYFDFQFHHPTAIRVQVHPTTPGSWRSGDLGTVELALRGGALDMVPLETGRLSFRGVRVDLSRLLEHGQMRVIGNCAAQGKLVITGTGLDSAIRSRAKELKIDEPHLSIRGDLVCFSALVKTVVIRNRVSTAGRFEIDEASHLVYHPTRLTVGVLPLPGVALRAIARRINPLADVSRLHTIPGVKVNITRLVVADSRLTLETEGGASLPDLPLP